MNKVMLLGRLTRDPEIRYSANQVAVTRFSVAVNRRFTKQGEERQADFFNCVCFRSTAEFVSKHFVKGQQLALVGSLQSRKWEDETGKSHIVIEVIAEEVYFTGKKEGIDNSGSVLNSGFDNDGFLPIDENQLPY